MAKKTVPTASLSTRQALARRKAIDYIRRLGLRKAAARLDTNVTQLRGWLDSRFPATKLTGAIGLGRPGGPHVYIAGTKLSDLIKQKGLKSLARLTGVPGSELAALAKKRPGSRLKLTRDRLSQLTKKKDNTQLAELLGTTPRKVAAARKIPLTQATLRLKRFAAHYSPAKAANYLGISQKQLAAWSKRGIPRTWEDHVNQAIGKRSDQGPDRKRVRKTRGQKQIDAAIEAALKKVRAWNAKAPSRFRIRLKEAERWARLGTFKDRFAASQAAASASKAPPVKEPRPAPPPKAPPRPVTPPGALPPPPTEDKPPKPPKPPKKQPPEQISIPDTRIRDFLEARAEAFVEGRYPQPDIPWNRLTRWKLINRNGINIFRKVEQFVHNIDLAQLGQQIIELSKKIWKQVKGTGLAFMTVRFMFSVMGEGNPFYPDAFVEGNKINFISRNLKIDFPWQIAQYVQEIMNEIYAVDTETMMFLEYYEIVKSVPNEPVR